MRGKNLAAAAAVFAAFLSAASFAQFTGPSAAGGTRASAPETAAAGIATAREGSNVTLTGNIVAHVRGDHFTFRDASGEVRVEIDDDIWRGRKIAPETRVRLVGEVDRDRQGRYVDVDALDVIP